MATDALIGVQDMGAAGLTCSTCEMGSRGGAGVEIDVMHVPQRETGMTPYEIMLSESQERMLLVVKKRPRGGSRGDLRRSGTCTRRTSARSPTDGLMRVKDHGTRRRRDREHARWSTRRRSTTGRPGVRPTSTRSQRSTSRRWRRVAPQDALLRAAGVADHRQQALGLPAVRPRWSGPTRIAAAGLGAGRRAREGHDARAGHCRPTATAATATSIRAAARCWRSPRRRATSRAPAACRSARPTA